MGKIKFIALQINISHYLLYACTSFRSSRLIFVLNWNKGLIWTKLRSCCNEQSRTTLDLIFQASIDFLAILFRLSARRIDQVFSDTLWCNWNLTYKTFKCKYYTKGSFSFFRKKLRILLPSRSRCTILYNKYI